MCLILLAIDAHPDYKLVLAANRDEFYRRPTAAAGFWEDAPDLLAGRDLQSGGTWLGVNRQGKVAAVTNYRDPAWRVPHPLSRGRLVADYLRGEAGPSEYLSRLRDIADRCDGFNLIAGDVDVLFYFSNRGANPARIAPGIHALSNRLLDTPWPKVKYGKERLSHLLDGRNVAPEELFSLMRTADPFPADLLPDTGVGLEREIMLSPLFIKSSDYGTRSTTIVFVDRKDTITFMERTFFPETTSEFVLSAAVGATIGQKRGASV